MTASGGGETCTADAAAGSCAITLNGTGSRTLTASYAGNTLFAPSSDDESHNVEAPNSPPNRRDDAFTGSGRPAIEPSRWAAASAVLANDSRTRDQDPLQAELASNVSNGTLTLDAYGGFRYTPTGRFPGRRPRFTYRPADASGASRPRRRYGSTVTGTP